MSKGDEILDALVNTKFQCECAADGCHGQICEGDGLEWANLHRQISDRNIQRIIRKLCPDYLNDNYSILVAESEHLALVTG